jgi:DNA-directed RNA polymerase specialized sigma24 family protein
MADNETADMSAWLPVIGKALCYLCLSKAMEREPAKYDDVLAKVKFLEGLGLSQEDAAGAAGSSAGSVRVMRHYQRKKAKNGSAKKKGRRGR